MTDFRITFSHPWLLLLLIPAAALTVYTYFRVGKRYRRNRNRVVSTVLHALVMLLCITVLSGVMFSYDVPNTENELIILVDASYSNKEEQKIKDDYVNSLILGCGSGFKVGVVKFGYDQVYAAPLSGDLRGLYNKYATSEDPDTSATNVASALRYAGGLFSRPQTGKIVLLSDGIETDENALGMVKSLAAQGIKVDAVHVPNEQMPETQIVGVELPDYNVNTGTPFPIKVTIQNNWDYITGNVTVKVTDRVLDGEKNEGEPLTVTLTEHLQSIEVKHQLPAPGLYELRFDVTSNGVNSDSIVNNNVYYSYIKVNAFDKILVIENVENESDNLTDFLRENEYQVTKIGIWNDEDADTVPQDLAQLCEYQQVVLVNISNADLTNTYLDEAGQVDLLKKNNLPEGFDKLLYTYVYVQGGGLLTVGGENDIDPLTGDEVSHAYNRNDMFASLYQQMLPVQVINYTPPVAVMIIIDHSGSMGDGQNSPLAMAKQGALYGLEYLSTRDYCGIMTLDTDAYEVLPITPVSEREKIKNAIQNISTQGDNGTIFAKAIEDAGSALQMVNVEQRHILLVTDGVPADTAAFMKQVQLNKARGVTMSIVGYQVMEGEQGNMKKAAEEYGGGVFYNAQSVQGIADAMGKDFKTEAVAEIEYGKDVPLKVKDLTSAVVGIENATFPVLKGYYGTREKQGVEIPLVGDYVPMYAQWKFGKGSVGSFMCDLNERWSPGFLSNATSTKFITNVVDSLFPVEDITPKEIRVVMREDNYKTDFNIFTELGENETVEFSVKPITDSAKEYYLNNELPVTAADGFKRFTATITQPGVYEITVTKMSADGAPVSSAVVYKTFSYSQEYNYFPDREPIGAEFLEKLTQDGNGILVTDNVAEIFDSFVKTIHVEYDPRLAFLIASIVMFLLDVAVRKFKFKWLHEIIKDRKEKKALK